MSQVTPRNRPDLEQRFRSEKDDRFTTQKSERVRINLRLASFFGLCLTLGITTGCGRPQEGQSAAPGSGQPHLTTIAPDAFAAAFAAQPSGGIAMDSIDSHPGGRNHTTTLTLKPSQSLYVVGWAFPASEKGSCSAIGLAVDGKRVFPGMYGYRRPDVAATYKDMSRTDVGYSIEVPAKGLGRGSHRGFVVCMDSAHSGSRSFNPLTISVR